MKILRRQTGLSLVELMITMVIFVLVIVAASNIFTGLLTQFKQQSKIAETSIEGMVGLQMLRSDIEQAGYGLPYDIGTADYSEAVNDGTTTGQDETAFNDAGATDAPPRAVLTGLANAGARNGLPTTYVSDVLVLKATNIAMNETARKWASVSNTGAANVMSTWTNVSTGLPLTSENLDIDDDRVTVVIPLQGANQRVLVNSGGNFYTTAPDPAAVPLGGFYPTANSYETYIIYGIKAPGNPVVNPGMPFNRADYYVRRPATGMPSHCAPLTGILYKATVNHGDGMLFEYPLLDCVAAMKIVLARDTNADGITDSWPKDGSWPVLSGAGATPAADIRSQLKEVRVYVVTHEGQRDATFTFPTASLTVTDPDAGALLTYPLPDRNYRWKVYTMVLKPYNLR
jgi:competence protein ComGC